MALRFARLAALFTGLHAIRALASLMFSISAGRAHFDNPALPDAFAGSAASNVATFLFQPGAPAWTLPSREAT